MREHSRLPMPSDEEILSAYSSANHMRYRSAEKCQIPDCKKNGVPIRTSQRSNIMGSEFLPVILTEYPCTSQRRKTIDKPDIGENDMVVEDDCMNCPITETLPRETQISVIDEEKAWYVRQWLTGRAISEVPEELEYPKKRIFTVEIEPTIEYLLSSQEAFYDSVESGFTVVNRCYLAQGR
eukprot:gene5105-5753_t